MPNRFLTHQEFFDEVQVPLMCAILKDSLSIKPGESRTFPMADCLPVIVSAPSGTDEYAEWRRGMLVVIERLEKGKVKFEEKNR
jgi:hypothetical protein